MITRLTATATLLALFCSALGSSARAEDPRKLVEEYLRTFGAVGYTLTAITDDYVVDTFPDTSFFAVHFRLYPVAIAPPKGLSSSNLFFVQDREVFYLTDSSELEDFFFDELLPVANEDEALDAGRSWLRLTQEFVQDGFYTFSDPGVVFSKKKGVWIVSGAVKVTAGGRGRIEATLVFDVGGGNAEGGVLISITESVKVFEGPRPICQATKLLDPDPIVRKMAETTILTMGKPAKQYLDEQRAKASPELQKAIDRIWKRILDEGW